MPRGVITGYADSILTAVLPADDLMKLPLGDSSFFFQSSITTSFWNFLLFCERKSWEIVKGFDIVALYVMLEPVVVNIKDKGVNK